MASVLDTAIGIAAESTYGTYQAPTRGYEALSDNFAARDNVIESIGFYGGRHTMVSGRSIKQQRGADGNLEFHLLNKGAGVLLQALLGTSAGPTQVAATTAYTTTIETDPDLPTTAYSLQAQRVTSAGTTLVQTFLGGVVTGWTLEQSVDDFLKVNVAMAFQDSNNDESAASLTYPTSTRPFHWGDCKVTINGVDTDVRSCSLDVDLGVKTDRYFLKQSTAPSRPVRAALPRFSGEIETEYIADTIPDLADAGTIVPIVYTWTGDEIESGQNFSLVITMAACRLGEIDRSAAVEDLPSMTVPFTVLWNEAAVAISAVYKSTDTTL